MSYLIKEIETLQNQVRGYESIIARLSKRADSLEFDLEDSRTLLAEVISQRDEAQDLLSDLQRSIPA